MSRVTQVGGNQGRGDPPAFAREFDTLRDRMQQPQPRSKVGRVLAFLLFAAVVTVFYVLNVKGLK
jgi:hypothetical protein